MINRKAGVFLLFQQPLNSSSFAKSGKLFLCNNLKRTTKPFRGRSMAA
jgi:hypothetical protein